MFRRKPLEPPEESQLKRTLTAFDLVLYGVGSSVGAGIYCLVGIGAELAGPAITLSFLCCGIACIFTSLAYAEFAARIPVTGSAYVYAYTTFGEFWGWLVGWNLTLGYGFAASVVARSWAEYVSTSLVSVAQRIGSRAMEDALVYLTKFPVYGDYTCSPLSIVIVGISTVILVSGAKESSTFNNVMTCFNVLILLVVVLSGSPMMTVENLEPFFPTGVQGVARGAGLVFFAFIGFDMVACLSEEVIDPGHNMPLGIVGSLVISSLIYVSISLVVVGMSPISLLGGDVPITNALLANACCDHQGQLAADATSVCLNSACKPVLHPLLMFCSRFVGAGAIFALTSACFVGLMGQPRIFYSMAKDGLLFPIFGEVNPRTHVPAAGILITGVMCAFLACFIDLQVLANVISLGTLLVFTFVNAAVIILRLRPWHTHQSVSERAWVLRTPPMSRFASRLSDVTIACWWESKSVRENGAKPTICVSVFTFSTLLVSIGIRDSWPLALPLLFGIVSALCVYVLLTLPRSDPPETFTCPLVPLIPLFGMTCNLFMAGSLPNSSWLLSISWTVLGIVVYFCYGLQHSTLRLDEERETEEGRSLMVSSSLHYNAIPSGAVLIEPPIPANMRF
jgi:APA family basic amino acid/polyamine antiporter